MTNTTADEAQRARDWLLTQYAEIEDAAREAAADDVAEWELRDGRIMGADPRYYSVIADRSVEPTFCQRQHMVLHDPRMVLADIAAKRDIIAELTRNATCWEQPVMRRVVLWLAVALSHRADYQQQWTPSVEDMAPDDFPDR